MAILAYVGIPGSGKSYEVVSSVILEHFKKGRRIVSNIVGVTQSKLFDYCVSKGATPEDLGEFISVSDEQCQQADFFPYKGAESFMKIIVLFWLNIAILQILIQENVVI